MRILLSINRNHALNSWFPVDTCSISSGDGWTWAGKNRFGLRSVFGMSILVKLRDLGGVMVASTTFGKRP